jgi:hypothetical protein
MNDRNDMDPREAYSFSEYDAYLEQTDSFEDWVEAMEEVEDPSDLMSEEEWVALWEDAFEASV